MKEILDIRFNGKLNSETSALFDEIAYQKRSDFNEFIALISLPNINDLDWWVEGPASRNTYSSPLFHYYCIIFLLNHLIQNKIFSYDEILIDSSSFAEIIEELLAKLKVKHCNVHLAQSFISNLKKYLKKHFLIFFLLSRKCFQILVSRMIVSNKIPNYPLVLIDTFLMPGFVDKDRWYGVLWDNLSDKKRAETFFVPTLVLSKFKDTFSIYKKANSSNRNYIFKENFLNFKDIIFTFRHKKRIKKIKFQNIKVLDYDFSNLIKDELNNNLDMGAVFESIFTYRFIHKFKIEGFKVRLAIDWFEGQNLDKAWNMGFQFFFPETKTIGYRATESFPFYLCSYPTLMEKEAKVLPDFMAIQGRGTESTIKEFMPSLDTILIPSFKSQYVWEFKRKESDFKKNIMLITLPVSVKSSKIIIERLVGVFNLNSFNNGRINLLFKPHPAQSLKKLKTGLVDFPNYISFTNEKSFVKLLISSSVLITEASSTCLEAMACGVPVIMMENQEGLTYDSIPTRVSEKLYKKVRSQDQLIQAMEYFINSNIEKNKQIEIEIESKKVRKDYFEPITQEGINRFMDIDNK